jgi:hypothetical protein
MKVTVKHIKSGMDKGKQVFMNDFIEFLQKEVPLKNDITIEFLGERKGGMSTGSRNDEHLLKVLSKNRLNRDICRTLAHEWIHEHQMDILKRDHQGDIGSQNENEANSGAGVLVKKFEKHHPHKEEKMYE